MLNLKELSKSDLIVLQYQIEATIRTRRIETTRLAIALKEKAIQSDWSTIFCLLNSVSVSVALSLTHIWTRLKQ